MLTHGLSAFSVNEKRPTSEISYELEKSEYLSNTVLECSQSMMSVMRTQNLSEPHTTILTNNWENALYVPRTLS